MSFLSKALKSIDRITGSSSTKFGINRLIAGYGEILKLDIDSKNKNIHLEVLLSGDSEAFSVDIDKYTITDVDGKMVIVIQSASATRRWADSILKNLIVGRDFEIPENRKEIIADLIG